MIDVHTALVVIWVLFAHWFADFVCQSRWQADNKSRNLEALSQHVMVYTFVLSCLLAPALQITWGHDMVRLNYFALITAIAHFGTDAITSRINAWFYVRKMYWPFYVSIGFDQVLHYVQVFLTIAWIGGPL